MMKSVILAGDAGALPYLKKDVPKNTYNFCCACTLPKDEQETTALAPIKRNIQKRKDSESPPPVLKSRRPSSSPDTQWKWTRENIAKFSNTSTMKKGQFMPNNQLNTSSTSANQPMLKSGRRKNSFGSFSTSNAPINKS